MRIPWNDEWYFSDVFVDELLNKNTLSSDMIGVRLPHSVTETPFNYFSEETYQKLSAYKKIFKVPLDWQARVVRLHFEGVGHQASLYVNGTLIQAHTGGYTAFSVDLSDHLIYGQQNEVVVKVDSRETLNCPPFGYVIDYMTYGGIYREVYLDVLDQAHIEDVFYYSKHLLQTKRTLVVETTLSKFAMKDLSAYQLRYTLLNDTGESVLQSVYEGHSFTSKDQHSTNPVVHEIALPEVILWELSNPYRYQLTVELIHIKDKGPSDILCDTQQLSCGFREAYFDAHGFWLNGQLVKLRGLNRHQSYPYVGYAMPKRPQVLDAQIMKNELHLNAVRTAHYPQSHHFIDACDELGLLVFTELPGWQHIGDAVWKEAALQQVTEMITQYRNHPSIILWGVRVNESADDHDFYKQSNDLAKRLDPSRQTGGVRNFSHSELLEDVYTYNDFSHNGTNKGTLSKKAVTKATNKAYLVSEYNGHMFPTKSFDDEAHRVEHALRHATVLESIAADAQIAGGFGWCLFDYNTHQDFGSGDRICHHGVLDMFRNHKLAAAIYSSQADQGSVLKLSSDMAIGDFAEGGLGKLYAFSNADYIDLYKNEDFIQRFKPDVQSFSHLPHPPFLIDDVIGELMQKKEGFSHKKAESIKAVLMAVAQYGASRLPLSYKLKALKLIVFEGMSFEKAQKLYVEYVGNWGAKATRYRFDAIKNDQVVQSVVKAPMQSFDLAVSVDTTQLLEDSSYDVATIRLTAINEHAQVLPYCFDVVHLSVEGDIQLIGPSVISMRGGLCGTYVRTLGRSGKGRLTLTCRDIQKDISFVVEVK